MYKRQGNVFCFHKPVVALCKLVFQHIRVLAADRVESVVLCGDIDSFLRFAVLRHELFLEYHPDIRFHLEIHPALLSEELKEELKHLPEGLLHLEAGIQRCV